MIKSARRRRGVLLRWRRFGLARSALLAAFLVFVLVPLYWVVVTSIKPSSDYLAIPPVWFPAEPTLVHYVAALFSYRGLAGPDEQPDRCVVPPRSPRWLLGTCMGYSMVRFHTGGRAPRLLGALAALPAAGRHRTAAVSALSQLRTQRHAARPGADLHGDDAAALGVDDVRLFPPGAARAGGGGAGGRVRLVAGVLADRRPARRRPASSRPPPSPSSLSGRNSSSPST